MSKNTGTAFPLSRLLCPFQDAVRIAQLLGIRQLWVDARCIIQEDDSDSTAQATLMTDMYGGAAICISALSATACNAGFTTLPDVQARIGIYCCPANRSEFSDIYLVMTMTVRLPRVALMSNQRPASMYAWLDLPGGMVSVASLHYTDQGLVLESANAENVETKALDISSVVCYVDETKGGSASWWVS